MALSYTDALDQAVAWAISACGRPQAVPFLALLTGEEWLGMKDKTKDWLKQYTPTYLTVATLDSNINDRLKLRNYFSSEVISLDDFLAQKGEMALTPEKWESFVSFLKARFTNLSVSEIEQKLHANGIHKVGSSEGRPPIFILDRHALEQLGLIGWKKDTFREGINKFFTLVWKIISVQPVTEFKQTPFGVAAHSHYWIITEHPEWFSIAGISNVMPSPADWKAQELMLYRFFTDSEIRLSNDPLMMEAAELVWQGEDYDYAGVKAEVEALEQELFNHYSSAYTLYEVQSALLLSFMKYWLLCKVFEGIPPKRKWEEKFRPYGFAPYGIYAGGRLQYQKRIEEVLRLASFHRAFEIMFSLLTGYLLVKGIAAKWPKLGELYEKLKKHIEITPTETPAAVTPPGDKEKEKEETKMPWAVLAAVAGLLVISSKG